MNWQQGKLGYYLDFALVPLLMLLALACVHYQIAGVADFIIATLAVLVGAIIWGLAEYWIHRLVFHSLLRKEHWLHHLRPRGYVSAPAGLTAALHAAFLWAMLVSLGHVLGGALFLGLEAGYLSYIAVHDAIHHNQIPPSGYLRRVWERHMLHHSGEEVNFGVVYDVWDRVFGTYQDPADSRAMLARRFGP